MKLFRNIFKRWFKKPDTFPYQIYCDMDGVLVDLFEDGVYKNIKDPEKEAIARKIVKENVKWSKIHPKQAYEEVLKLIRSILDNNTEHWANLKPMADAKELWAYISRYDVKILSHPWDKKCIEGKKIWIEDNLTPTPSKEDIFLPLEGKKERWAVTDGRPNVLIDDFEQYLKPWREAGGIAIHHTSAKSTIKALEALKKANY